jgi:hypothetical protein
MLLINKPRPKPIILEFIEAVLGRIPPTHPRIPAILVDKNRHEAGYTGEKRLDTYLKYLPEHSYNILNDLRLSNGPFFFQIDSLLLDSKKILLVDAKNMKGKLYFDKKFGQLIQNDEVGYEDPIVQAEMHVRELKKWLKDHKFPIVPIEYLILMSNKKCILYSNDSKAIYHICRGRNLIHRIDEVTAKYSQAVDMLSPEQYRKLIKLFIKKHIDPSYNIETLYQIPPSELLPGVHCPDCNFQGMVYCRGSWLCKKCGCKSKDAHLRALRDYFLLFGPRITNQQFRVFLCLDSEDIAYKLLKKLNLPSIGKNKHRIYHLSWDIWA